VTHVTRFWIIGSRARVTSLIREPVTRDTHASIFFPSRHFMAVHTAADDAILAALSMP
jgi:hypothetical protein